MPAFAGITSGREHGLSPIDKQKRRDHRIPPFESICRLDDLTVKYPGISRFRRNARAVIVQEDIAIGQVE